MAILAIAAAGAAIGYGVVGTALAAQIGWAIGSVVGASFAPNKKVQGQLLSDLRVVSAEYGTPIPYVQGTIPVPGQFWWNSDRRPIATTTTSGGKGGGGGTEVTTYTYEMDALVGFTVNEMAGVVLLFFDGELVWSNYSGSSAASLAASDASERWTRMTVYNGAADQEADPTYQAGLLADSLISAAADAPAYRGRLMIFFEGLQLGSSGRVPNIIAVVSSRYPSPNTTLAAATLPSADQWAAGNGYMASVDRFVAYSGSGKAYSEDGGATWLAGAGATTSGGGNLVANSHAAVVGCNGGCARTTDGINWADITAFGSGSGTGHRQLAIAPDGRFVLISAFAGVGVCHRSVTGASGTWGASATPPSGTDSNDIGLVVGNGHDTMVAFASRSGNASSNAWVSHDNGGSWTRYDLPVSLIWTELIWNGRYFLAFDNGTGTLLRSRTGLADSWEQLTLPSTAQWYSAAALRSRAVLANTAGSDTFYYSTDDGGSWTALSAPTSAAWRALATNGYRWTCVSTSDTDAFYSAGTGLLDLVSAPLDEVVEALCLRAGLSLDQIDTTDLQSVTREVRGLALAQVAPTRQAIELLMSSFFFEPVVSDKIYFRPRGTAAAATLAYEELGAYRGGGDPPEPLELTIANDLELPAQIAVTYLNASDDYQNDTQYSDRLVSAAPGTVASVQLPLALIPSEAKAIADTMLLDQKVASISTSLALLGDHAALEPTDVVVATALDGSTYRLRLVKRTDAYPLLEFDAVLDDASILSSQGITSTDYTVSTVVAAPADTELVLMDMPILRDADDDAGFTAAARGSSTPWAGAALFKSVDDVEYNEAETFTESAVLGDCTTKLGDWSGPFVFDELSSVTVSVGAGTLSSTTRAAILLDSSVNAAAIGSDGTGWEIMQFRDATLLSSNPNVYTLTGFLRGMRGTEWMMAGRHAATDQFVLLRTSGLRRIAMETSELGVSRYWKGVTLGRSLSTATAVTFANHGVGKMPFSPVNFRALRDGYSGDIALTWSRRSRLATRFVGPLGGSVPLGEESESYEIDIVAPGSPDTVLRTISAADESATYSAAQQSADLGSPTPSSIRYRVYQVSATVGRGRELEATVAV